MREENWLCVCVGGGGRGPCHTSQLGALPAPAPLLLLSCARQGHQRKVADKGDVVGGPGRGGQGAVQRLQRRRLQHAQGQQAPAACAVAAGNAAIAAAGSEPHVIHTANKPAAVWQSTEFGHVLSGQPPASQRTRQTPQQQGRAGQAGRQQAALTCRGRCCMPPQRQSQPRKPTPCAAGAVPRGHCRRRHCRC